MLKWINKKRNQKGFTLIELVVVIAILGILAAIAIPRLSRSREAAQIAAHNANVRTLESVGMMYIIEFPKLAEPKVLAGDELKGYLQKELVVPAALDGKVFEALVPNDETPPQLEQKSITITAADGYKVNILKDGTVFVTPGQILTEDDIVTPKP